MSTNELLTSWTIWDNLLSQYDKLLEGPPVYSRLNSDFMNFSLNKKGLYYFVKFSRTLILNYGIGIVKKFWGIYPGNNGKEIQLIHLDKYKKPHGHDEL